MQLDRYRWQDRVLDPYRWSIDVAVMTVFAVALSISAIMHLTGDARAPELPTAFAAQTKAKSVQHADRATRFHSALICSRTGNSENS
ncbi:MAG: hypothetical protein ACFCUT_00580 [Kiloniellaceae bacterium]